MDNRPPPDKGVTSQTDSEAFSWNHDALCAKSIKTAPNAFDIDMWFQEDSDIFSLMATNLCFQCPIREACLKKACENEESDGIWGGQPASLRARRHGHNFQTLVALPNPYQTTNTRSRFHPSNLKQDDDNE